MSAQSDKTIIAYADARKKAGTVGDGNPVWNYSNGWYSIGHGKFRRAEVEMMTAELLKRAQARK